MLSELDFDSAAQTLAEAGREFYTRGWVMGTSGNFSALLQREPLRAVITASGHDKGALTTKHFLEINGAANVLRGAGSPSAETGLHLETYRLREAEAVLHTHSVWGTILSDVFFEMGNIEIQGYEMLKGLAGVTTHEHCERVPIIENSQDYQQLSQTFAETLRQNPAAHGIYLRRHGLYTWGKTIAEARRHIEIFEFLFEVLGRRMR